MNRLQYWSSSTATALALAAFSAWLAVGRGNVGGSVHAGPWRLEASVGSANAGMYARARTSIHALMALQKRETLYYIATHDSAGEPLDGSCTYVLKGTEPAARWWSITAYGADHFLIENEARAYSFAATTVAREPAGDFLILISAAPRSGNWLPVTRGEPFDLTMRLYGPEAAIVEHPSAAALPSIVKEGCS